PGSAQRARPRRRPLALPGGASGLLPLTRSAACKRNDLLDPGLAVARSIVLSAGVGVLGVVQSSGSRAVLGFLGGFLAPIWLSPGSGNPVALFS
ncbi:DUF2339 domain-containing protein, partial [Stenotrophomonas sp. SrG]|uniref:DUF2339 domain-containing protein n=1 Tax=Stenotrophomonas sp. SrG TaxID=3414430 RepID=UPI003CE7D1F3